MWRPFLFFFLASSAAAQTLAIGSATLPALPGFYAVAPESLVIVIPNGPPELVRTLDLSAIKLQMQPRGSTQVLPMTVVAGDSGIVRALVPANAPLGRADVTMTANAGTFAGSVFISRSSFGLYSAIRDGSGPAISQHTADSGAPVLNQLTNPALLGQM
jgi:hypothetical protein